MKSCKFLPVTHHLIGQKNATFYNISLVFKPFVTKKNARLLLIQLFHIYNQVNNLFLMNQETTIFIFIIFFLKKILSILTHTLKERGGNDNCVYLKGSNS